MAKSKGKSLRRWLWIGAWRSRSRIGTPLPAQGQARRGEGQGQDCEGEVADVQVRVTEVGSVEPDVKVDVKSALSARWSSCSSRGRPGEARPGARPGRADVNQARDLSQVKNAVSEAEIGLTEAKATYERNKAS